MISRDYSQGWRPCYGLAFLTFICNNGVHENLFVLAGKNFSPLDCNQDIEIADCTTTFSSLWNTASVQDNEVVIPCGTCAVVDYADGSTITFNKGLNIQGKLFFPPTANVEIYTSHVFVMGVLEMEPPAAGNKVKFRFFGVANQFLRPIENNAHECDATSGCNLGKKPFAVAGGMLCPSSQEEHCMILLNSHESKSSYYPFSSSYSSCSNYIRQTQHSRTSRSNMSVVGKASRS